VSAASPNRRLAAIMVADVVGYSRLMEADEAGTLAALMERRKGVLEPVVNAHGGRIVKLMGDGVLVEFASAVNAVQGAIELQKKMAAANEGAPDGRAIVLRIGINLGDVIGEGSDIYGEGVNIAARLEPLAEPGGLIVSANVHDQVRGKVETRFEDLGEQQLKNIARAVRAYRLGDPLQHETGSPLPLPDKPSIVVLPFVNMSSDPAHEYMADSMTEDLITALSRIGELFVISRNSSFVYKGRPHRIETVAKELGVRYVLEGSVRAFGDKMRVTAQLIDGTRGNHVWAERYDESVDDVFAVQDRIARNIALALQIKLTYGELARLWEGQTKDLRAWEKMALARSLFLKFNTADNQSARTILKEALEIDPKYTGAMVLLGLTFWVDARFNISADKEECLKLADAEAERALSIDPDMGSAHMLKGGVYFLRDRYDEAIILCRKAVRLAPSDSWAMAFLGLVNIYSGDGRSAVAAYKEALRLSPHPPAWYTYGLALAYQLAGDFPNAEAAAKLNVQQEPDDPYSYVNLTTALAFGGHGPKARKVMSELRAKFPGFGVKNIRLSERYKDGSMLDRVVAVLREAGLPE